MSIRPFEQKDRQAVRQICIETGLKGNLHEIFEDSEIFADLWLDPYLRGEPESCLVALAENQVVGYLVANQKSGFKFKALKFLIPTVVKVAWRAVSGVYKNESSCRFAKWLITNSWREAPRTPRDTPSFHFNVSEVARGAKALGDELIAAFCDEARNRGHTNFYIQVFSSSKDRPLPFYLRVGFEIFDVRETSVFPYPAVLATLVRKVPTEHRWQSHKVKPPLPVHVYGTDLDPWAHQAWPADGIGLHPPEDKHIGVWAPASFVPGPQSLAKVVQAVRNGLLSATTSDGLSFAILESSEDYDFWTRSLVSIDQKFGRD
ncbi:MAG: hypothetical protein KF812_11095 [Fimbriimonadaceae bacterium]|nr:hypothetical protein [Fimbriimonadaceae bacterium]